MSSGWDSSSILACLKKYYKNKKIIPLILELRYGLAKPVNQIEIIKAKKICDYYKLKLHKVVIDYTKKSSLEGFHESSKKMCLHVRDHSGSSWLQPKIINYLGKISDENLYAYNVYQIEGEGKNLFSSIEGDKNTIMGLPVMKIKEYLETYG